jgi:hypothetical protein
MTYNATEISIDSAQPMAFYEVYYSGETWRWTNAGRFATLNDVVYEPIAISHPEMVEPTNLEKSGLAVTVPLDNPVVQLFRPGPPSERVYMRIFIRNLITDDDQFIVGWQGRVVEIEESQASANLQVQSAYAYQQRQTNRHKVGVPCPHVLYDPLTCRVDASLHQEFTTITGVTRNGGVIASGAFRPLNFYGGGKISWVSSITGTIERRGVRTSNAGTIVINGTFTGLADGMPVIVLPGCAHDIVTCNNKFNNKDNYGGAPYWPNINPFAGVPIY